MRKIYAFLLLLLIPMLAVAQTNTRKAISKTLRTSASTRTDSRLYVDQTIFGAGLSVDDPLPSYSLGAWINLSGYLNQDYAENNMVIFGYGGREHCNDNGSMNLCLNASGSINITGWGTQGAKGLLANSTVSTGEWHHIMLAYDATAPKITVYLDGEVVAEKAMTQAQTYFTNESPAIYFASYGFGGLFDEAEIYLKALTADEVKVAMANPQAVENLAGLYTFEETPAETGTFNNKSTQDGASSLPMYFENVTGSQAWANGIVYVLSSGTATKANPTLADGREVAPQEVNITLQQPAEGGTFTVNDGTTDHSETFTTNAGTELTLTATPAEGYNLVGFYTVNGTTETAIEGNTFTPVTDATLTAHFTAETYTLTVANEQQIPYTLTYNGAEVTDLTTMLGGGAEYVLTLDVPNDKVLNAVRLGETELTANTNGEYTFTMSADATLTIDARAKALYAVTITQPEGGTISVSNNGTAVASGEEVLEGTVLTLSNTPESGYRFSGYTVDGNAFEGEEVTVNAAVTISGLFEEGIDYCIPTCAYNPSRTTTTRTDRGIRTIVISADGATTVTIQGSSAWGRPVYNDVTGSTILVTKAGKTVNVDVTGDGSWMHTYCYADWDLNGFTIDDQVFTNDNKGDRPYSVEFPFDIPANLAPGDYRVRYVLDWENVDPCEFGHGQSGDNGEAIYDFIVRVESDNYETPRTITVASSNDELGTVAITNPATEEKSVSTVQKNVTVTATPAEKAAFKNWTNADGEVVSTEATYIYTGETDITLTANFGHTLNVTVAEGGSVSMATADGATVNNGDILDPDTQVVLTITPPEGKTTVVSVNGGEGIVCDNNVYAVRLNENTTVDITFQMYLTFNVVGDGTVECWSETPDEGITTGGTQYLSGATVPEGDVHFWAKPAEGKDLTSVTATTTDGTIQLNAEDDYWMLDDGSGRYFMYYTVEKTATLTFTFSDSTQGIDEIGIDPANGPVEYYNLQGVRVDAENLVPGFYIVRQGNNAKKVFIQK